MHTENAKKRKSVKTEDHERYNKTKKDDEIEGTKRRRRKKKTRTRKKQKNDFLWRALLDVGSPAVTIQIAAELCISM